MRVVLCGGGTAGHINPAIAIANYLNDHVAGVQILFVGTPTGMEKELVEKAGYDYASVRVRGFMRRFSLKGMVHNAKATAQVVRAQYVAAQVIKAFAPDLVIGTGGYVSGPVVKAASRLGIKTMIHEQNAFPGVTNKWLARKVDCVLLAVEEARAHFPKNVRTEVVGNPIRETVLSQSKQQARQKLGIPARMVCILSFGGSLGARIINRAAADLLAWNRKKNAVFHIHGYGRKQEQEFSEMLTSRGLSLQQLTQPSSGHSVIIRPYLEEMGLYLAAADLVICRAGAMTLSELQACGKASILIPSPYVAENHQYHNAMVLRNHGAAEVVVEQEYTASEFLSMVEGFVGDEHKLSEVGKKAAGLAVLDTTQRIYQLIQELLSA